MIIHPPADDKYFQFYVSTLRVIVAKAYARYPGDEAQLRKAIDLIIDGHVDLQDTGALVTSSDGRRQYQVNGGCQCEAYRQGMERCKHRWAATIARKLHAELEEHKALWETTYSTALRDERALAGNDVAIVCNGPVEIADGNGEIHTVAYRGRNGGQYEKTAGR